MDALLLYIIIESIVIAKSWKRRTGLWIIGINFIFSGVAAVIILFGQWPITMIWFVLSAWIGLMILTADAHYFYSYEH